MNIFKVVSPTTIIVFTIVLQITICISFFYIQNYSYTLAQLALLFDWFYLVLIYLYLMIKNETNLQDISIIFRTSYPLGAKTPKVIGQKETKIVNLIVFIIITLTVFWFLITNQIQQMQTPYIILTFFCYFGFIVQSILCEYSFGKSITHQEYDKQVNGNRI